MKKIVGIIPPMASPISSPFNSYISPSMHAFSQGTQEGNKEGKMDSNNISKIALIVACITFGVVLLSLLCLFIYHKMSSERTKNHANKSGGANGFSLKQLKDSFNTKKSSGKLRVTIAIMDYKLLEEATSNFHERNVLGKSGYGRVYKAKLDDNHYVAVKKVDDNTQQAQRQFENEVMILSKIQHQNVITLTGYCIHGSSRFLVYQLMENGSLETHLHGTSKGSTLTWHIRLKIALDIARGLEYLHEHCNPPIIHRDLKSSNILLDSKFNAKLSDFNFAITDGPHSKNNIKLLGTLGYVAPEYLLDGNLTEKSDVYAFGVILLELLLGRKPMEKLSPSQCQSIVTWAMPQMADRSKLPNIVDPVIRATMDSKHLYQVAAVAVLCVQPEPSYRPLITDVLHSLAPLVPVELGGTLRVNHRASLAVSAAFT